MTKLGVKGEQKNNPVSKEVNHQVCTARPSQKMAKTANEITADIGANNPQLDMTKNFHDMCHT